LPEDLQSFIRWYETYRYRKTGPRPSPVTVANKLGLLTSLQRQVFPRTLPELATDRALLLSTIGKLSASMTTGSVRNILYALQDYGTYATEVLDAGPCVLLPSDFPPKNPPPAISVYSDGEVERLVWAAYGTDKRFGMLVDFLAHTGRRVGEVLKLEWAGARLEADPPYWELPMTKNGQPQYIPLGEHLAYTVFSAANIEQLKAGRSASGHSFTGDPLVRPFPWSYSTVHGRFGRLCRNVGVDNRGFHNFRHTVITQRLAAGVPIQAVAALAGHSSVATTDRRYNHTTALSYAQFVK